MTSPRAAAQVHSRQRIRRGSSPRDGDAAGRQSLTRQCGKRTRLRESGSSAGPIAACRRSIGSARSSCPVEAMTRRSSSRGCKLSPRRCSALRPPNRECGLGPTCPCSAPDDRQVVAVALVRPFETCRRKRCPATWGVWTYAGLLLADCRAGLKAGRIAAMRRQTRARSATRLATSGASIVPAPGPAFVLRGHPARCSYSPGECEKCADTLCATRPDGRR